MLVSDVMTEAGVTESAADPLTAAASLMWRQQTGSLLVMEGDECQSSRALPNPPRPATTPTRAGGRPSSTRPTRTIWPGWKPSGHPTTTAESRGIPQASAGCSTVQNAQRLAPSGIRLRQSGHSLVFASGSGWVLCRLISALTGRTTRK